MRGTAPQGPGVRLRRIRLEIPSFLLFVALAAVFLIVHAGIPDLLRWILQTALEKPQEMHITRTFDVIAGLTLLGFVLPKAWGYGARRRHAEKWKTDELVKWGFHSRDRQGPMINYVYYPVCHKAAIANGKRFYSEWLVIHDGYIIVNPGESIVYRREKMVAYDFGARKTYAWDGCTPKWFFWWFVVFGTPDWVYQARNVRSVGTDGRVVDKPVVWQLAHHASLVHDALCQYIDHIPLSRNEVNVLFREMLREAGMWRPMAWIYYAGVWCGSSRRDRRIAKVDTGSWQPLMTLETGRNGVS